MTHPDKPRTAFITGASAGIGMAFAEVFAKAGFDLVLSARRQTQLDELAARLRTDYAIQVRVMVADLSDDAAPQALFDQLSAAGVAVDVLVNNAGYGLPHKYAATRWDDQAQFIQVMVTAVCHLTHLFLPGMVHRGYGRILNVASLAGLVPGSAGHTLYGASKAFLIRFSESIHAESAEQNVFCTALCPGFTHSEFHDVAGTRQQVSRMPSYLWMSAEAVAREGYAAVMSGVPVQVTGRVNRFIAWLARHLPPRLSRRLVQRRSKDFRKL